jgi:hypothetical protein
MVGLTDEQAARLKKLQQHFGHGDYLETFDLMLNVMEHYDWKDWNGDTAPERTNGQ